MKKLFFILFSFFTSFQVFSQNLSVFNVKYLVTYEATNKIYTAWVVPEYDTPNYNNADTEEKGATAQFTLKIPTGFVISELKDIKGVWDKKPFKIGGETALIKAGADPSYEYYVIGKAPVETNYGAFKNGEPVALFSFKGQGAANDQVQALDSNDPIIKTADQTMALNLGNSFYSRSGQKPTVFARPLEQFSAPTKIQEVLTNLIQKATKSNLSESVEQDFKGRKMLAYPNPVKDVVNIKYFSEEDKTNVILEIIDLSGKITVQHNKVSQLGINTWQLDASKWTNGAYVVRLSAQSKFETQKLIKTE